MKDLVGRCMPAYMWQGACARPAWFRQPAEYGTLTCASDDDVGRCPVLPRALLRNGNATLYLQRVQNVHDSRCSCKNGVLRSMRLELARENARRAPPSTIQRCTRGAGIHQAHVGFGKNILPHIHTVFCRQTTVSAAHGIMNSLSIVTTDMRIDTK